MNTKLDFLQDLLKSKPKNQTITESSKKAINDAQIIIANRTDDKPFVDVETGKSYKTESAMKGAITRRTNKEKS